VGAYLGWGGRGTGIVGVFNLQTEGVVTEVLPLGRFPGVTGAERYVVRSHTTGRVTKPLEVGSPAAMLTISLGPRGCDVLSAYPLHAVLSETKGEVLLANLGLVGKMTGCAAVLRTTFEVRENGRMVVDATVKALGVLGKWLALCAGETVILTSGRHLHLGASRAVAQRRLHGDHPGPADPTSYCFCQ
jgi:hypothetical protein